MRHNPRREAQTARRVSSGERLNEQQRREFAKNLPKKMGVITHKQSIGQRPHEGRKGEWLLDVRELTV